ncbi:Glu-tRNA(Gln) amidotransferase subunit GatD [Candidatus Woesearchaeota archaeon]|nr:Glu-tRNA(Gln) amidotransferase subunit GatD [Candidatus Woesearchaeota archaeon]
MERYNTGDRIKVTTDSKIYEGLFIDRAEDYDPTHIILKLDNGYNIGIDKIKIKTTELISKKKDIKKQSQDIKTDSKKPTISILHTGGTIASKVDYSTGGVTASFSAEDLVEKVPELHDIANVRCALVSNMMSEDMRFSDYKKIALAIEKEVKAGSEGIIIGHGTDTLAVTAAALSFICEKLPVPVLIVGSQRSSDRGSTDAVMNLICAAEFIIQSDFAGVGICMHKEMGDTKCVILPGTKSKKMHTSRRDAFKVINDNEIAEIDYKTKQIVYVANEYSKKNAGELKISPEMDDKIAIIRSYTNMHPDIFNALMGYDGWIIEGTGLGHAQTNTPENEPNLRAIEKFIKKGGIVVMTSQCIYGRVHPYVYSNLRRLHNLGVIYGEDMLTDTAYVKLAWLLANVKDRSEVAKMMAQNLHGEINDRLT